MPPFALTHRVSFPAPATHLVNVETELKFDGEPPEAVVVCMPVWTPGSYMVREYARQVEGFAAEPPARAVKVRKNAWEIRTGGAATIAFRYRVYAGELTVRTSHVDDTHAFLVGAALFTWVDGHAQAAARIEIVPPPGHRVATSLPFAQAGSGAVHFEPADFDTIVDSPIQIGTHREERFVALGKEHRYCITPAAAVTDADVQRLVTDTRAIVETEATFFGGSLPYPRYDILLHLASRGRGGLEHRSSVALIAPASSFATREAYLDLLSLVAHELFHVWNVKRIRPAGLSPYRYSEENYTRLLWWFEGATSYYDWRTLAIARLCKVEEYLEHLAGEVAYLDQTPGRLVHSLEEASFDAWIKLYRPDENSANSSVSYYRKGEVVCALLDIEIASRSGGKASLDSVVSHLWQTFGRAERPVPEDAMLSIFEEATGVPLGDLFEAWIRTPGELRCEDTFARVGLTLERTSKPEAAATSLGARLRSECGKTLVAAVAREGAAWHAGVDPGDEIVAIGGVRVDGSNVDSALRGRAPGQTLGVTLVRDGRLLEKRLVLEPARRDRVRLVPDPGSPPAARAAFQAWIGQPHPSLVAASETTA